MVNTETHNWSKARKQVSGEWSAIDGTFLSHPDLQGSGIRRREPKVGYWFVIRAKG